MVSKRVRSGANQISNFSAIAKVFIVGALPFFFLFLVGGVSILNLQRMGHTQEWVDHTQIVLTKSSNIMLAAVDMETGMRGYLLAGSEEFLEPYESGSARVFSKLELLRNRVNDNPPQVDRLFEAEAILREWQETVAEEQIKLRRAIGDAPTMNDVAQLVSEGRGKFHFDGIRTLIADFVGAEAGRFNEYDGQETLLLEIISGNAPSALATTEGAPEALRRILGAKLLLNAAVDMETGIRGFLLTGNEVFLEPYNTGKASLSEQIDLLSDAVSGDPAQLAKLAQIEQAIDVWRA
ncbi:MAG: CHASE3 domain-containing protein, partial [Pseudomonadota bacterium]